MTRRDHLTLDLLPGRYAVVRTEAGTPPPAWAASALAAGDAPLAAIVRRGRELSVVCAEGAVPHDARAERGFAGLAVRGPLDFALTGILAALAAPLAAAEVPIFAISTFDTDVILVPASHLDAAHTALTAAGHEVAGVSRFA